MGPCWCQTSCTHITFDHVTESQYPELAIVSGTIPADSGLVCSEPSATYFVGDYSTSYNDAKTYCAERDASLVTIHSQAENEAAYSACIAGGMRNCWLGLEAYGSEWYWHTGEALSWTNWDGSEGTCFCGEDRAFFKTAWHGDKWHDVSGCDCEDTYPLCERSGGATTESDYDYWEELCPECGDEHNCAAAAECHEWCCSICSGGAALECREAEDREGSGGPMSWFLRGSLRESGRHGEPA